MNPATPYRGRLAPSPTGYLHLGHARTFWRAQQRARARGGTLILRNEDLDAARFKLEFVGAMLEDLRWFGFAWSEGPDVGGEFGPYNQSQRMHIYRAALDQLRVGNFVYPCTCSRRDIQTAATAPHAADEEVIYPGTCRPRSNPWLASSGPLLDPPNPGQSAANSWPGSGHDVSLSPGERARVRFPRIIRALAPRTGLVRKLVAQTVSLLYRRLAVGRPPRDQMLAKLSPNRLGFMVSSDSFDNNPPLGIHRQGEVVSASRLYLGTESAQVEGANPLILPGNSPQPSSRYAWRFRVPDGEVVSFTDGQFGRQRFVAGQDFGDFVVWRGDDVPAYQLACVVDDAAMRLTEVVRGADLLVSTARQLLLYRALALTPPDFFHCELLCDAAGQRLAKRHDALSLRQLRAQGATPQALRAGWADPQSAGLSQNS